MAPDKFAWQPFTTRNNGYSTLITQKSISSLNRPTHTRPHTFRQIDLSKPTCNTTGYKILEEKDTWTVTLATSGGAADDAVCTLKQIDTFLCPRMQGGTRTNHTTNIDPGKKTVALAE